MFDEDQKSRRFARDLNSQINKAFSDQRVWVERYVNHALRGQSNRSLDVERSKLLFDSIIAMNEYLLSASRQGGFLAAGVIASVPIWSPTRPISWQTKTSLICLIVSILLSCFSHFFLGFKSLQEIKKIVKALPGPAPAPDTNKWGSLMSLSWIAGWAQAATLMVGISLAAWMIVSGVNSPILETDTTIIEEPATLKNEAGN